jgi:integrase
MTRGQAEAILAKILEPVNEMAGRKPSPYVNHTFGQFVDQVYLPVYRGKWKISTTMVEEDRLQYHLVRRLGERPIAAIMREELQKLLETKAKKLSKSVVSHLRFRLRSIFDLAICEGAVDRNPAKELYTPKNCAPGRARRLLTLEDLDRMIQALDEREHLIARLATWEGMRPGEILGLQIGDLDLSADCLWVRRRVYRTNVDCPKTDRSARQVALSLGTIAMLELWVRDLAAVAPDAWVFPIEAGNRPHGRDYIWTKKMLPKLKAIGMEWATFQVMRRSFATKAKEAGVDAHTRSAQMGNTVDVNENEYAVSDFPTRLAAIRKLEATLKK